MVTSVWVRLALLAICGLLPWTAAVGAAPTAATPATAPAPQPAAPSTAPSQIGIDRPAIVVPATRDEVTVRVTLRGLDEAPVPGDLETGLLTSSQQPNLQVRPPVTLLGATPAPTKAGEKTGEFVVELRIQQLVVFGESSAPLLYKGRQVESLRFSKPGLVLKQSADGSTVAREGADLSLELTNPTAFEYTAVKARLRFSDQDVCLFDIETFRDSGPALSARTGPVPSSRKSCGDYATWTKFDVPKYAQVTLRARPARSWFLDPGTERARSAKRKGWLTLRFQDAVDGPIHEQSVPLELQFEPGTWSLLLALLTVAGFLLAGAFVSLLLRVSVPNIKRRRQLKDQLREAATLTATISTEVDSNLRVLLRVERLALEEIRIAVWSLGPGYADYAARVEQALPSLLRRIEAVRRLDAALTRKRLLAEQGIAPTRLQQIETLATSVSETLKQDKLSDEDWVFVNQHVEALQKALREPTQTEKEAFEAMLVGRWRTLRDHFGVDAAGALTVPAVLRGMEACFPDPSLLPRPNGDEIAWVRSVGPVRADLQLSALMLVYEYQFLAPATTTNTAWSSAKEELTRLLATPTNENLRQAKLLLRQLADGVAQSDVIAALQGGHAAIVMDPALPRPNQKIRFSVRFRDDRLNTAAARDLVKCHWLFHDYHGTSRRAWWPSSRRKSPKTGSATDFQLQGRPGTVLSEEGWYVHHYFEDDVIASVISLNFHDSKGQAVDVGLPTEISTPHWARLTESVRRSQRPEEKWARAWLELVQLAAALLVPLATLASTTINGGSTGHWWEIVAIGFGSDTIKNILVGRQESETKPAAGSAPQPGG